MSTAHIANLDVLPGVVLGCMPLAGIRRSTLFLDPERVSCLPEADPECKTERREAYLNSPWHVTAKLWDFGARSLSEGSRYGLANTICAMNQIDQHRAYWARAQNLLTEALRKYSYRWPHSGEQRRQSMTSTYRKIQAQLYGGCGNRNLNDLVLRRYNRRPTLLAPSFLKTVS